MVAFNIYVDKFIIMPLIQSMVIASCRWSHAVEIPSLGRIFIVMS